MSLLQIMASREASSLYDTFEGSGAIDSGKWDVYEGNTYNSGHQAVTRTGDQYSAAITGADADSTSWFNDGEGLLHYVEFAGDFEFIARNIGINSGADAGDFQFGGVICWLSSGNWEFAVAGNRAGNAENTIEYKVTISETSNQNDIDDDAITSHKCDLRVTRSGSTVNFYYQQPGESNNWTLLDHDGLSGGRVGFNTSTVRVGLVSYGFASPANFTITCDQVEIPSGF